MRSSYVYDPHLWPAIFTVAITAFLAVYSWRRRKVPGARPFAIGSLFAMLWGLGTVMEISAQDFSTRVFWVKFETVWQMPTATAIMCFILVYAGLGKWLTRRNLILLAIPPLITMVIVITNDYHHLVWTGFRMGEYIIPSIGGANRFLVGYTYVLALINLIVLLWLAIRSPQHRWPVAIMLIGQIIGRGLYLLNNLYSYFMGPGESLLVVIGLISSTYAIALFRFHVFDPVPAARAVVLEQMREGILVLDLQGRIVDLNPAAEKIFNFPQDGLRGSLVTSILPECSNLLMQPEKTGIMSSEISLGKGNSVRYYNLNLTLLTDRSGQALGHLVLLHDDTGRKRAQEQILEDQKVVATLKERERLARELHDSTGQVLGYVNLQAETIRTWLQQGNSEKADSLLVRLAEVAREAHADVRESILSLKTGSSQGWSFLPTIKQYLDDFQSHYGIQTELILKDGLKESYFKPDAEVQLLRVIQEALTNARKHSGALKVKVTIEPGKSRGYITVTDNGTGFDPHQLDQKTGRHFGLTFMRERMAQIGGSLTIDSSPGAGTVVKLDAPARDQLEEAA